MERIELPNGNLMFRLKKDGECVFMESGSLNCKRISKKCPGLRNYGCPLVGANKGISYKGQYGMTGDGPTKKKYGVVDAPPKYKTDVCPDCGSLDFIGSFCQDCDYERN